MIRNPRILRAIALLLLIQFITQVLYVPAAFALTSGPAQPEFSSFEPVATTNMVDEFSGDFTYNLPVLEVPGPQGSGYPISLSYHSGVGVDQESSWVGLGWTLNPGAISRNARGIPDDYNGQDITYYNDAPKNWTGTVNTRVSFGEIFGFDLKTMAGASVSLGLALRYNNYRGFGYNTGVGLSLGKGVVALGYNFSDGTGSFSLDVNPAAIMSWSSVQAKEAKTANDADQKATRKRAIRDADRINRTLDFFGSGSSYGIFSYTEAGRPGVVHPYTGNSFNVSLGAEINPGPVPVGFTGDVTGSYTYQKNVGEQSAAAYGYLYSANATDADAMDYHVEKEKDYSKRDVFLGVPFNDADNFILSGEGLSGGFRFHNKRAGQFGPRKMESQMNIYNVGLEFAAGWTLGPGVDLGVGSHAIKLGDWNRDMSKFKGRTDTDVDEPVFLRFNNDMGGEWGDLHDNSPIQATHSGDQISLGENYEKYNDADERSGRSSYIGYHTNGEMISSGSTPSVEAYSKNTKLNERLQRGAADYKDLIGELAVFNETGNRYVYALPSYAQEEKNLSFSATGSAVYVNRMASVTTGAPNASVKVGEEQKKPYATTYLLTEITTPDYLDADPESEPGPSTADLGGYTRFNYTKAITTDLFAWRSPYKGLVYQRGSNSDPLDDLVSYAEGKKEIYYLKSIETKTHIAFFDLDSEERKDGMEAYEDAWNIEGTPKRGTVIDRLKRLKTIKLYLLSDCPRDANNKILRDDYGSPNEPASSVKPIKTVYFDYDYSLCPETPNSSATGGKGKLTLRRVYTEYNGIQQARISPYFFDYRYPTSTEYDAFPTRYKQGGVNDVTAGYTTGAGDLVSIDGNSNPQNPAYDVLRSNAWGDAQKVDLDRFTKMQTWVDQRPVTGFDPAAWHLKKITLPSGGEIHVQYEQDDYSYVQDQPAHVMAPLSGIPDEPNYHGGANAKYYLDVLQVGIEPTIDNLNAVRDMINARYPRQKKIYFKFLYTLVALNNTPAGIDKCNTDFISGYASVEGAGVDEGGLYVQLVNSANTRIPRDICMEFVSTQRVGKLDPEGNCNAATGISDPDNAAALVNKLAVGITGIVLPESMCRTLSPENSYFRIPTPMPKKGGGLRVKRLMMSDRGFDGVPVLYGSEYVYQCKQEERVRGEEDGRRMSSGVATNEPLLIREENVLVQYEPRIPQTILSKIIAGRDREVAEGPVGETMLPEPSVGYSQVIVKNIYSDNTNADHEINPGFSVSEFYTARDYPLTMSHPNDPETMTRMDRKDEYDLPILLPMFTQIKSKTTAVQGFRFILNNMHGQPRSNASYTGEYANILKGRIPGTPVSRISYKYYEPGDDIPVMNSLYDGLTYKNPGREVDLTYAQRKVTEVSDDINVEVDLQLAFMAFFAIPFPTAMPSYSHIEGGLYTHATTKVVRYPAILKSTTILKDGITHTEENRAFDEATGRPVSVRSSDEFKGGYLVQSIPASWEYKDMGGKWRSENKTITGTGFSLSGDYVSLGTDPCDLTLFTRGDLIQVGNKTSQAYYYVIERDYLGNRLKVERAKGWKASPPLPINMITIVRSGRTNQLQEQAGAITFHDEVLEKLTPPVIDEANRYVGESFAQALQTATLGLTNTGNFTLQGAYSHMDMSGFATELQACVADPMDVTISDVQFRYVVQADKLTLQLMKFTVACDGGTTVTVKAEGWN